MSKKKDKQHGVPVIFRKFRDCGDVVAVFPSMAGDNNPYNTCGSYQHLGQHGAISLDYARFTWMARLQDYAALQEELESLGYVLKIVGRRSVSHDTARHTEARAGQ